MKKLCAFLLLLCLVLAVSGASAIRPEDPLPLLLGYIGDPNFLEYLVNSGFDQGLPKMPSAFL